uniref:Uncharacterized protein n=1 Tax=Bos indicus x Bos taurus TaxID=30522 RepID=A0A4W2CNW6_BOBOX
MAAPCTATYLKQKPRLLRLSNHPDPRTTVTPKVPVYNTPGLWILNRCTHLRHQIAPHFQPVILEVLVCPLSKKAHRCEESTDKLISEYVGNPYHIIDGILNMIQQGAKTYQNKKWNNTRSLHIFIIKHFHADTKQLYPLNTSRVSTNTWERLFLH